MSNQKTAQMLRIGNPVYEVSVESIKELKTTGIKMDSSGIIFSIDNSKSRYTQDEIRNPFTTTTIKVNKEGWSSVRVYYTNRKKAEQVQLQLRKDKLSRLTSKANDAVCELHLFSDKYFK